MASDDICGLCGADVLDIDQKCPECGADLASTAARRLIGTILLSDYEVLEVLGQGGMAVVYRGRHRVTGQEVALKVLPPDLAAHRDIQSRFVQEAKALAQLDHPNIVHLYNFDSDGGSFVLAMQLADGPTWERLILEDKMDWRRSVEIALEVCAALEYAHSRGIVHRDMKPSNVLIRDTDGTPMVMDFGIAKGASDSRLTATGQTMGTVRYMSPEQVRGKTVDKTTDIYSLAVTLYESIAGETPFSGDTQFEIMSAHLQAVAEPLSSRVQGIPPVLSDAVAWAMSKRPEERPQTAGQFADVLRAIAAGQNPSIPRVGARPAPVVVDVGAATRSKLPIIVGVAAVVVAIASAGVLIVNRQKTTDPPAKKVPKTVPINQYGVPDLPPIEFEFKQDFPRERLRLWLAGDEVADPYVEAYRRAVAEWGQFLASKEIVPAADISTEMPKTVVVVAPADLLCLREKFKSRKAWDTCRKAGEIQPGSRSLLIPSDVSSLSRSISELVPLVYCEAHMSDACLQAAGAFQLTLR